MSKNSETTELGLPTILFLIFMILKLTGNIDWSWWWVTSPIWIIVVLILIVSILQDYYGN